MRLTPWCQIRDERPGEPYHLGANIPSWRHRQIKRLGADQVFARPKNDLERDVPLPDWVASAVRVHLAKYPPRPCTLPREKITGKPRTHSILFRWNDGAHVRYRDLQRADPETRDRSRRHHPRAGHRQARSQPVRHHPQRRTPSAPALLRLGHARRGHLGQGASGIPRPPRRHVHPARPHPPAAQLPRPCPPRDRREDVPARAVSHGTGTE